MVPIAGERHALTQSGRQLRMPNATSLDAGRPAVVDFATDINIAAPLPYVPDQSI